MLLVVCRLSITGSGTESRIDRASLQQLVSKVGPGIGAIPQRRIQSRVVQLLGSIPAIDRPSKLVTRVRVASGDDNLKLFTPLTLVVGRSSIKAGAPERTLDVCESVGIWAARTWFDSGVTFEVDIERQTAGFGVALGGTVVYVVTFACVDDSVS